MTDGITIKWNIKDFEPWRKVVPIILSTKVDTLETGEIRAKKRGSETIITYWGQWETFTVIIKEIENLLTTKKRHYLTLKGSLHKNYYKGTNYLPFTWQMLQDEILHLTKTLQIPTKEAHINGLEIGLNITTSFPVSPFISENLIMYKRYPFIPYNKDAAGICLGKYACTSQYSLKIYDKGLQNKLDYSLIRIELRYTKMQILKRRGIKTLNDLQQIEKVNPLFELLQIAWQNVFVYDIIGEVSKLSIPENSKRLLRRGRNFAYWDKLRKAGKDVSYPMYKILQKMTIIGNNWHKELRDKLDNGWKTCFEISNNLPSGKNDNFHDLTIKVKGKKLENSLSIEKRFCLTCNRPLHPGQRKGSIFCTEKYVGEAAAKHCRNLNSNPRNYYKQKLAEIQNQVTLFDTLPYLSHRFYELGLC